MSETKTTTPPTNKSLVVKFVTKHARSINAFAEIALPLLIMYSRKAQAYYKKLPADYISFAFGFIICFFGGVYPALFAAFEAARHGGAKQVQEALNDLADEAMIIIEASKKDDDLDLDNDGIKDVDAIDSKKYAVRKAKLVMKKINPEKVNEAMAIIYKVWFSVVAVLSVKFAKTVAFAESICDFLRKPINRYVVPPILAITSIEYQRWAPILVNWATKSFAVWLAFSVKSVCTALTSSLTGALLMTRALMTIAKKKGWEFGGFMPKENHENTMFDEYTSYFIAFMGFKFQWNMGFDVPFPLNMILFPLEFGEYMIRSYLVKA